MTPRCNRLRAYGALATILGLEAMGIFWLAVKTPHDAVSDYIGGACIVVNVILGVGFAWFVTERDRDR